VAPLPPCPRAPTPNRARERVLVCVALRGQCPGGVGSEGVCTAPTGPGGPQAVGYAVVILGLPESDGTCVCAGLCVFALRACALRPKRVCPGCHAARMREAGHRPFRCTMTTMRA
jgi:hypothetical protein